MFIQLARIVWMDHMIEMIMMMIIILIIIIMCDHDT